MGRGGKCGRNFICGAANAKRGKDVEKKIRMRIRNFGRPYEFWLYTTHICQKKRNSRILAFVRITSPHFSSLYLCEGYFYLLTMKVVSAFLIVYLCLNSIFAFT